MKSLPSKCNHQGWRCMTMGLLFASSVLFTQNCNAEESVSSTQSQASQSQSRQLQRTDTRNRWNATSHRSTRTSNRRSSTLKPSKRSPVKQVSSGSLSRSFGRSEPRRLQLVDQLKKLSITPRGVSTRAMAKHPGSTPIRQVAVPPTTGQSNKTSGVMKELEALYSQDGRQMPSMSLKDAPHTQRPVAGSVHSRSVQQSGTQPHSVANSGQTSTLKPQADPTLQRQPLRYRYKKPTLWQRLLGRKPQKRPIQFRPVPLQQYQPQPQTESHIAQQKPATQQPVAKPQPAPHPQPEPQQTAQQEAPQNISTEKPADLVPAPAVEETPVQVSQKKKPQILEQPKAQKMYPVPPAPEETVEPSQPKLVANEKPVATEKRVNNLENPFPDMSETQADNGKQSSPFTGLKLEEDVQAEQASTEADKRNESWKKNISSKISSRKDIPGLKGFCIVTLRDKRDLIDSKSEFSSEFEGTSYHFSSAEAKAKFDASPITYAPIHNGNDIVLLSGGSFEEESAGSLEFAAWYQSRLYLFKNSNSLKSFMANPQKFQQK